MTIDTSSINPLLPQDSDLQTQDVRDNFDAIKTALDSASTQIDAIPGVYLAKGSNLSDVADAFISAGNIKSGYVVATKAEAAALTLTSADAGRKIFVTSDDGGEFTIKYNATPGTYADDGGSYCGTQFIPSGGDGTIGIVRDVSGAINVLWFGAVGDGVTDDTSAIQKAIDAAELIAASFTRAGVAVYFPGGEYLTQAQLTLTSDYVTLEGDGSRTSVLYTTNAAANIIKISKSGTPINSIAIQNMGFACRGNATSGDLIRLEDTLDCTFNNVGLFGWYNGISCVGINRCYFDNIFISQSGRTAGIGNYGFLFTGDVATGISSDVHISNCQINLISSYDFLAGIYVTSMDGLYVVNSHFGGGERDILIAPTDTTNNSTAISMQFDNCYFDANDSVSTEYLVAFIGTASTNYKDIRFTNCQFRAGQAGAVQFNPTTTIIYGVIFNGCTFNANDKSGISCGAALQEDFIISNCTFIGNNTDNGSNADIVAKGDGWNINGCVFTGGGASGFGINLGSDCSNAIVSNNNLINSTAGTPISNSGTGNKIIDNLGSGLEGWLTLTSITANTLPAANNRLISLNVSGGATINDITSNAPEIPVITIRNANATSVTLTHNTAKLRNNSGANITLATNQSVTYAYVSGTIWQEV